MTITLPKFSRRSKVGPWPMANLGSLCNLVNGDAFKPEDWSKSGVPIIRIQNLNDAGKPFNHWAGTTHDRVIVKAGDVLIAWSGTPGTSFGAHIWRRTTGVLNQHIFRVDFTNDQIDSEYFAFAVNHFLDNLIRAAHGAVGLAHVTKGEVQALQIPLPPLPEQKRVAALLTDQLAAVDRARHAAEQQLAAANALPAASLAAEFDAHHKKWQRKCFGEIAELLPARSIATDGDAEVKAVTTACLTEGGFSPLGVKSARMKKRNVRDCTLKAGEILIARSNTPDLVGRVSRYLGDPSPVVASDLTIRIMPVDPQSGPFICDYLSYLYLTGFWKERAGGASGSMKKITREQLKALQIPFPQISQQNELHRRIEESLQATSSLIKCSQEQLFACSLLPTTFLREAFSLESHGENS